MLTYIFILLLLAIAVACAVLRKTYSVVPAHELKRQAAAGNQLAKELYRAVSYGVSLRILLWKLLILSLSVSFVLLATAASWWLSVILIGLVLYLLFSWFPTTRVTSAATRLTQILTPAIVWLLHYVDPVYSRWSRFIVRHQVPSHSGLYEVRDLLDLLDLQSGQTDSRITTEEISLIRQVLTFGDRKVRDVLRPRAQIKAVALGDTVGPVLLNELHASGQTVFPVKKTSRGKEIVASLHVGDIGIHSVGTVADYATNGVKYVNEADSLADALHQFYQTKQQLFVVIDAFEEYVGVLTLEDILFELTGQPAADEKLGSHDDSVAVAARHDEDDADKTQPTVVE